MADKVIVAVDAMGGDNAPAALVEGSIEALKKKEELEVILVGLKDAIEAELKGKDYPADRLSVVHASEVITTDEQPVTAVRSKKDSSLGVGMRLVRDKKADCFISCGSTGAVMVGAQLIIGRMRGVPRTPLGTIVPTQNGVTLIADAGANVDVRPEHLRDFAILGSIYMEHVVGIKNPRVALLNIGVEEEKGNALVKAAKPLLKELPGINYIGSIEARDISMGAADVIVCDGFAGNIALKMYEGVAKVLLSSIKTALKSSLRTKIGALLILPSLKSMLKTFDATEYGGAPLLGLNGLAVKTHGNAKAKEVCNTLLQCIEFQKQDINGKTREALSAMAADKEQA